jgi:hypothetical protein
VKPRFYSSCRNTVMYITFVIYYILVSFKSWCRAPCGWHNAKTCRGKICIYQRCICWCHNSIKILTINNMKNISMCILDFSVKIYFINSSPMHYLEKKKKYCIILTTIMWSIPKIKPHAAAIDLLSHNMLVPWINLGIQEVICKIGSNPHHWLITVSKMFSNW